MKYWQLFKKLALAILSSQFQRAILSLEEEDLSLCRRSGCPLNIRREKEWQTVFNNSPAHFHMNYPDTSYCIMTEEDNTLQVFMMKDVLWELLIIEREIDFVDDVDRNVMFANDVNLRIEFELKKSGRYSDTISSVRVPTWERYVEALILLALSSKDSDGLCSCLLKELEYMARYDDPHRLCHSAFTRFLLSMIRPQTTFRAIISEALKVLDSRLHNPRPDLTSAQWEFLLGETPK